MVSTYFARDDLTRDRSFWRLLGDGGRSVLESNRPSHVVSAIPLVVEHHSRCDWNFMNAAIEKPPTIVVDELPIGVREAAVFLGVSPQTMYLLGRAPAIKRV